MRGHLLRAVSRLDPDAAAYITAVQAVDGQVLESAVASAINSFFVGCKADGTWSAIKACCILAGARTLPGALIPLVGVAPTNYNFVSGDYDRKTGLKGNGSTKYLDSNRNNTADPQNSKHLSVYRSVAATNDAGLLGTDSTTSGDSHLYTGFGQHITRMNAATAYEVSLSLGTGAVFHGASRSNSSNFTVRVGGTGYTSETINSQTPASRTILVFRTVGYTNARISFYSIGESVNLAALDARVTALMSAFASAIP